MSEIQLPPPLLFYACINDNGAYEDLIKVHMDGRVEYNPKYASLVGKMDELIEEVKKLAVEKMEKK